MWARPPASTEACAQNAWEQYAVDRQGCEMERELTGSEENAPVLYYIL